MKRRRKLVEIGDTFRKTDATRWVWQVAHIFQPPGHCVHARLVRKGVADDVRVFALAALRDRRLFAPIDKPENGSGPTGPAIRYLGNDDNGPGVGRPQETTVPRLGTIGRRDCTNPRKSAVKSTSADMNFNARCQNFGTI